MTAPVTEAAPGARLDVREIAVSIRGVSKRFPVRRSVQQALRHPFRKDSMTALARIDCDVRRGEFFGFLGPNGAGKTTLFKIIATLILPDEGIARVEGLDAARDGAAVRRILAPVVADERSLHWRLSAYENLRLFAELHGVRSAVLQRQVRALLDVVGLGAEGRKLVGTFSSGMKQRLLIARALIAAPKVLLLDEPTRSMDPITARDFRVFLREEIAGQRGCTVLLATHNTEEALQLCERVAILNRGRVLARGAPAALKEQFGDERYRFALQHAAPSVLATLEDRGVIRHQRVTETGPEEWSTVELEIPGGPARVAQVVDYLVSQRVAVARCERVDLSLADLIERVLHRA
jgi:ABC-2 type transport system ATP-binding protein